EAGEGPGCRVDSEAINGRRKKHAVGPHGKSAGQESDLKFGAGRGHSAVHSAGCAGGAGDENCQLNRAVRRGAAEMSKILLVEDNEMNRDMLSRRLIRKGYEVVMAVDGQQAVAMASSEMPDLILMDMSLPDLDGWEATRQIKATSETSTIPVIA